MSITFSATSYQRKLSRMSNESLLKLITAGKMNQDEATIAAKICERRFPTPMKKG